MRTVIVLLGIILVNVSSARAYSWEAVCDVDADYALGLEDYSEAIRLHQQLLTLHPGNALAHYHLGFAYGMTGRSEDEIREYLAAASLGANDWDLYLNLGVAYLGLGNFGKSIESFRHGLSITGEHYELHLDLGIAYERSHRLSEALQEISTAMRLNPTAPEVRNMRATIYGELGDLKKARDEWDRLTRTAPDYVPARDNLELLDDMCDEGPGLSTGLEAPHPSSLSEPVEIFCNRARRR